VIPDPELVLVAYLEEALDFDRVFGDPPDEGDRAEPWIMHNLHDAPDDGTKADHLVGAFFDLHVYSGAANDRGEASHLARRMREKLKECAGRHGDVVLTGAEISGFGHDPDEDMEPARHRYVVEVTLWMHS
jgi:hypothetical protein